MEVSNTLLIGDADLKAHDYLSRIAYLLFYAIATVFRLYHGGDLMY